MSGRIFSATRGVGEHASGQALIADVPFSARYDLDRVKGVISRSGHPLEGQAIAGKVLVFPSVQGGVAGAWAFLAMRDLGVAPAGLVFGETNPVMVQGAVAAGIPLLAGIDPRVFQEIAPGDLVEVDPYMPGLRLLDGPA